MIVVNITLFRNLIFFLLLSNTLAAAIWHAKQHPAQRSAPRAVPYTSLKSELSLANLDAFPSQFPNPDETIGQYFDANIDRLSKNGSSSTDIDKRNLIRTSTLLESVWYDGQTHWNISIEKCITFNTIAGQWTFQNGTTMQNATLLNINEDLQSQSPNQEDPESQYSARVLANANVFLNAAEPYLKTQICNYDYTSDPMNDAIHDELRRKLLGVDGYWVATLYKSALSGTVAAGVYAGFFNPHNHTTGQVVAAGVATAGVTFMIGVIDHLQLNGRLSATEASIISVFTAWYNQALHALSSRQVGPDSAVSGQSPCFSKEVVEDAIKNLADYYDVEMGFDPQLSAVLGCTKHD